MRFAAILSARDCSLYRLGRGAPRWLGSSSDLTEVERLLVHHAGRGDEIALYGDFAEETYARSALPRLWSGAMRRQLIERRLRQEFADQPYRAGLPLASGGWQPPAAATLVALPDLVPVQGMIARAEAHGLRVAGLWPLSLLLASLAGSPTETLLTLRLPSGLRHVLVVRGMTVFSRLLPTASDEAESWMHDAERTAQYLAAQGWVRSAVLRSEVWHSHGDAATAALQEEVTNLDLGDVRVADDIYQLALRRRPPAHGQLLPPQETLAWRSARLGRWAITGAAGCLAAVTFHAALAEWHAGRIQDEAAANLAAAQRAADQTTRVLATARGNVDEAGMAQVTVQTWTSAVRQQPQAQPALRQLSAVLEQFPQLELRQLAWRAGRAVTTDCEAAAAASTPAAAGAAEAPVAAPAASAPWQSNHLELALAASLPAEVALRERVETQRRFEGALRQLGWTVQVTKPFVELGTAATSGLVGELDPATLQACLTVGKK